MERITYRKTLDVHKNGTQFMLQGFETADNMSRVIEISLMASGDAIDFPLERMVAMMYVTTPGATEPSINECTIKDNKVVYDVLPIVTEGITTMQLKLIETGPDGATSVLASPKFSVEVTKSDADDEKAEKTTTFTALEEAMAKAKIAYDERFLRMELSSDCIFRAYYADGTTYETDVLKKLFLNGNVLLSESFAHGGTGVRAGEDTDNSKYYSDVSKSEALNAKNIMEDSKDVLEDVRLHGVYTAFSVDFETGEVEYVSPSFKFNVNLETGELDAEGQTYTFEDEMGRVIREWLGKNGVHLTELQEISTKHTGEIVSLQEEAGTQSKRIDELSRGFQFVKTAEFKEAGTYTWTPTEEDLIARFVIIGAGAGGSGTTIVANSSTNTVGSGGGGGAAIVSDIISLEEGADVEITVGTGGAGGAPGGSGSNTSGASGGASSCMGMIAPGGEGINGGIMPTSYIGYACEGARGGKEGDVNGKISSMMSSMYPYQIFSSGGGCGGRGGYKVSNSFAHGTGGKSSFSNGGDGGDCESSAVEERTGKNGTCGGGGGGGSVFIKYMGSSNSYQGAPGGNGGDGYVAIYTLKRIGADKEEGGN